MDWIKERVKEPSTWAAVCGVTVGVGVLLGQPMTIIVGIAIGAGGFFLKEKGLI